MILFLWVNDQENGLENFTGLISSGNAGGLWWSPSQRNPGSLSQPTHRTGSFCGGMYSVVWAMVVASAVIGQGSNLPLPRKTGKSDYYQRTTEAFAKWPKHFPIHSWALTSRTNHEKLDVLKASCSGLIKRKVGWSRKQECLCLLLSCNCRTAQLCIKYINNKTKVSYGVGWFVCLFCVCACVCIFLRENEVGAIEKIKFWYAYITHFDNL